MFAVASGVALTDRVEGSTAVGAVDVSIGVLSATFATVNHQNSSNNSNLVLVLRFAVIKNFGWSNVRI
jgi:hypothetical protein